MKNKPTMSQYILISHLWTILARALHLHCRSLRDIAGLSQPYRFSKVLFIECQNGLKSTADHVIKSLEFDIFYGLKAFGCV